MSNPTPHGAPQGRLAGKVSLITGAAQGIGEATALKFATEGAIVIVCDINPTGIEAVVQQCCALGAEAEGHVMDVTNRATIDAVVAKVQEKHGRIDVLVNNAGYGSYGAIEDVPIDEARRQFEVNLFGLGRLVQLVTPHMRGQKSGTIINISSMGGRLTTPLGGWYHATKYAVEALSDALRMELKPFGIDVVLVEPGGIRTEWAGIAADHLEETAEGSAYSDQIRAVAGSMRNESVQRRQSPPAVIANAVEKIVTARKPRTRYAVGFMAKPLITARRVLPDRAFDRVISAALGVPR